MRDRQKNEEFNSLKGIIARKKQNTDYIILSIYFQMTYDDDQE